DGGVEELEEFVFKRVSSSASRRFKSAMRASRSLQPGHPKASMPPCYENHRRAAAPVFGDERLHHLFQARSAQCLRRACQCKSKKAVDSTLMSYFPHIWFPNSANYAGPTS